jgi:PD-(D/E)XK nuclease superfamily protein
MSFPVAFQPLLPFDDAPPPPTDSRLVEELARVCRDQPLAEKVLVAPTLSIGHQLVECLARSGTAWINLRVETARTLAHSLVGPALVRDGLRLLSRAQALALVEEACAQALGPDSYFGRLSDRPGLHRALQSTLDEIRSAGLQPDRLPAGAFVDPKKHRELRDVFRRHASALETGRWVDAIEILRRALEAADSNDARGQEVRYLLPATTELSSLERRFLEKLSAGKVIELGADPPETWVAIAKEARLFRATGEENEIREVFRRILRESIPFDEVEILHTDPTVYPALIWELAREQEIPCNFAGGIAAAYTRPGRATLAFLDWIGQDFAADVLREALASGALTIERLEGTPLAVGSRAVVRVLRRARLGWGRQRQLDLLDRFIADLEKPEDRARGPAEDDAGEASRAQARRRDLEGARLARRLIQRALALAPHSREGFGDLPSLARGVRTFVSELARTSDELDGTAQTALDVLFQEFEQLPSLRLSVPASIERLRDAVASLSVAADRPRPGRVHVAFFRVGGFSGRRHTFLLGLDEARHPGPDLEDPILLDAERRQINEALPTPLLALWRDRPRESAGALRACLARVRGRFSASYSCFDLRNLSQSSEPAPSPFFLELYRAQSGIPEADYRDLSRSLPSAAGFVPEEAEALDESEWWLRHLRDAAAAGRREVAASRVRSAYPWLENGLRGEQARESDEFTVWDGWIRSGTPELDPRSSGAPISASRIQELAHCPFAYFLRNVLGVRPPEDLERDPAVWLDPRSRGSLLHEVFKDFFEEITAAGQRPEVARHRDRLETLAQLRMSQWRERVPPPSELAFAMQRDDILFACRTLLTNEEEHCRNVTPRFFEVPFGMAREARKMRSEVASPDPVEVPAGRGRLRLRGSIDRVDEAGDGTFHVWDYKTGSAWGIQEGRGLLGGRQIQPALYAMALEALLERAGRPSKVSQSGYFLPGRRGEGQRIIMPIDRSEASRVLGRLFDLVAAGMFPHAISEDDCKNCELQQVCGGAKPACRRAKQKVEKSVDAVLCAFREIHAED